MTPRTGVMPDDILTIVQIPSITQPKMSNQDAAITQSRTAPLGAGLKVVLQRRQRRGERIENISPALSRREITATSSFKQFGHSIVPPIIVTLLVHARAIPRACCDLSTLGGASGTF